MPTKYGTMADPRMKPSHKRQQRRVARPGSTRLRIVCLVVRQEATPLPGAPFPSLLRTLAYRAARPCCRQQDALKRLKRLCLSLLFPSPSAALRTEEPGGGGCPSSSAGPENKNYRRKNNGEQDEEKKEAEEIHTEGNPTQQNTTRNTAAGGREGGGGVRSRPSVSSKKKKKWYFDTQKIYRKSARGA